MSNDTVKVKMNARELVNAEVEFISLVGRPANRIPFRITKSENTDSIKENNMFQLNKLASILKGEGKEVQDAAPTLVAVCVTKSDDKITKALKDAGYSLDSLEEVDGLSVFKQSDYDENDVTAFQMENGLALLMTGVQKSFDPWKETSSFTENLGIGGFYPGMWGACEALMDTVHVIMRESEDTVEATAKIKVALDDHSAYIMTLTQNLPEIAFKMEDVNAALIAKSEEIDLVDDKADTDADDVVIVKADTDVIDADTIVVEKSDTDADVIDDEDKVDVEKSDEEKDKAKADLKKSEEAPAWATSLQKSVDDLASSTTESLESVTNTIEGMQEDIATVQKSADATQKAIDGTVISTAKGDVDVVVVPESVKKAEAVEGQWAGTSLDNIGK